MNKWEKVDSITITKAVNGYIVEIYSGDPDDTPDRHLCKNMEEVVAIFNHEMA